MNSFSRFFDHFSLSSTVDLGHFYIDVSNNSDGSAAQQCAREPNKFDTGTTRVYPCPCGMFGRYVRIRYDVGDTNHLLMCEVQVQPGGEHSDTQMVF